MTLGELRDRERLRETERDIKRVKRQREILRDRARLRKMLRAKFREILRERLIVIFRETLRERLRKR